LVKNTEESTNSETVLSTFIKSLEYHSFWRNKVARLDTTVWVTITYDKQTHIHTQTEVS